MIYGYIGNFKTNFRGLIMQQNVLNLKIRLTSDEQRTGVLLRW